MKLLRKDRKVRARVERSAGSGKYKWLVGTVIGTRGFVRDNQSPLGSMFNLAPTSAYRTWNEDKLLIRLSVGGEIQRWESETFEVKS